MPIVAVLIIRFAQLAGLLALLVGVQQFVPLASLLNLCLQEGDWPIAKLCGQLAMVTGPSLIGLMLVGGLQWLLNRDSQTRRALLASGTEPWMTNPQWAAKHIQLSNRPAVIALLLFLCVYLFLVLPIAIATEKTPILVVVGIVGLFVLLLFRIQWMNRKWNRSELRFSTMPGLVGGPLTGVVILQQNFPVGTVFEALLKCERTETTRHNNKAVTKQVSLWSSLIHINKTLSGSPPHTTAIPISFAIPFECEQTSMRTEAESVRWVLSINEKDKISMGGALFEVPVFRTADSQENFQFDAELIEEYLEKNDPEVILRRYNMVRTPLADDFERFEFTEYEPSIFFTLVGVSVFLLAVIAGIFNFVTTWKVFFVAALLPIAFLAMMIFGIVIMLFWKCTIETGTAIIDSVDPDLADPDSDDDSTGRRAHSNNPDPVIWATAGILGFRKTVTAARDSSSELKCVLDSRSENKEQWSLQLCAPGKDKLKLIPMLKSSAEAHTVQSWLSEQLGIAAVKPLPEDGFLRQTHG